MNTIFKRLINTLIRTTSGQLPVRYCTGAQNPRWSKFGQYNEERYCRLQDDLC